MYIYMYNVTLTIYIYISKIILFSVAIILTVLNQTGSTDVNDNIISISLVNC